MMMGWALLLACEAPAPTPARDSDPPAHQPLEMGRIFGTVTLGKELADGVPWERDLTATLFVVASLDPSDSALLLHRVHATAPIIEPLDEISIPYVLENLFPMGRPYQLMALFDLDSSVWETGLFTVTPGDLLSSPSTLEQQQVWMESGEEISMDLVLTHKAE